MYDFSWGSLFSRKDPPRPPSRYTLDELQALLTDRVRRGLPGRLLCAQSVSEALSERIPPRRFTPPDFMSVGIVGGFAALMGIDIVIDDLMPPGSWQLTDPGGAVLWEGVTDA